MSEWIEVARVTAGGLDDNRVVWFVIRAVRASRRRVDVRVINHDIVYYVQSPVPKSVEEAKKQ